MRRSLSLPTSSDNVGPEVAEVIGERVNDACSKRAMEPKLKDLYEKYKKYKTPVNIYVCLKST